MKITTVALIPLACALAGAAALPPNGAQPSGHAGAAAIEKRAEHKDLEAKCKSWRWAPEFWPLLWQCSHLAFKKSAAGREYDRLKKEGQDFLDKMGFGGVEEAGSEGLEKVGFDPLGHEV